MNKSKTILYLVNVDWFFLSHRMSLAIEAKKRGYQVIIAAADTGQSQIILENGLRFVEVPFIRTGNNIFNEIKVLFIINRLYRRLKPDIVHHVTIKPVLLGSLVSRFLREIHVINAITGMGSLFSENKGYNPLRMAVRGLFRVVLGSSRQHTIFQNPDDLNYFVSRGLVKNRQACLIPGSGVDTGLFTPSESKPSVQLVLMPSRMIVEKGVAAFCEAAKRLKPRFPDVRFILAGKVDIGSPGMIPESTLKKWASEGSVEWIGYIKDMPALLQLTSIVVLPTTYPEGVPKSLIEAASCGIPIVTSDRPGCREIVYDGVNGLFTNPNEPQEIADAIEWFLTHQVEAEEMGRAGRKIVLRKFTLDKVLSETMNLYEKVL